MLNDTCIIAAFAGHPSLPVWSHILFGSEMDSFNVRYSSGLRQSESVLRTEVVSRERSGFVNYTLNENYQVYLHPPGSVCQSRNFGERYIIP